MGTLYRSAKDGQRNPADRHANAQHGLQAQLFAQDQPAKNGGHRRVQGKDRPLTPRPQPSQRGKVQRVADQDSDDPGQGQDQDRLLVWKGDRARGQHGQGQNNGNEDLPHKTEIEDAKRPHRIGRDDSRRRPAGRGAKGCKFVDRKGHHIPLGAAGCTRYRKPQARGGGDARRSRNSGHQPRKTPTAPLDLRRDSPYTPKIEFKGRGFPPFPALTN